MKPDTKNDKTLLENVAEKFGQWSGFVTMACFIVMAVAVTADVVMRALTSPIPGVTELTELLLVIGGFLAMSHTQKVGGHLRVGLISNLFPVRVQRVMEVFILAIFLGFVVVIGIYGGSAAYRSFLSKETAMGLIEIPVWPGRVAVPIGCFAFSLQLVSDIVTCLLQLSGRRSASKGPEVNAAL